MIGAGDVAGWLLAEASGVVGYWAVIWCGNREIGGFRGLWHEGEGGSTGPGLTFVCWRSCGSVLGKIGRGEDS